MTENKELELESEITEEQEMEDIKIQGVFLFLTTIHSLDPLSDEEFGEVIRAVANYAETGVLPELDDGHSAAMLNFLNMPNRHKHKNNNKNKHKHSKKEKKDEEKHEPHFLPLFHRNSQLFNNLSTKFSTLAEFSTKISSV